MHLRRAGLEEQHMPPVLQRRHVLVERLPVVGDDDHPALGRELPGDALPLQAARVGVPGHGLGLLGLAQALEQADAAAVGVEGVDVVDDDELIPVPVELGVHAERRGVALDPAALAVERGADGAAFAEAAGADEDEQVEMPLGEGAEVRLQPLVGGDVEGLVPPAGSWIGAWQAWRFLGGGASTAGTVQAGANRLDWLDLPHEPADRKSHFLPEIPA